MRTIRLITGLLLATGLITACIERYYSDEITDFKPQLVIDATICPDEGMQEIVISKTSSPDDPQFVPLSGCSVMVEDEKGDLFSFYESADAGHYKGEIDGSKVVIGNKYRLSVRTPQGKDYKSSYEELMPCPPIDSLYFALETKLTNDPNTSLNGLQFYTDFKADNTYGHYYRFELIETYEYHAEYPLKKWQDQYGIMHNLEEPDYSNMVCYKTSRLRNIFNLSTDGFTDNSYPRFKLHFVKDQAPPLKIKYSVLVNQYSMDKKAYVYWENLRKNNQETTDLFGKQPAMIQGNIVNVKDSSDIALGYFEVSSLQSKRIMVQSVEGLSFDKAYYCKAKKIFGSLPKKSLVYLAEDFDEDDKRYEGMVSGECIFCQLLGGSLEKPSYWDQK
jgi:hypothetical protein